MSIAQRLLCRTVGHRFETFDDGLKRQCKRCAREEWAMSTPFPRIGEPTIYWHHMDWNRP